MAITSFTELVTQINNMLSNFATTVGNDIIAENRTGTTLFDKGSGYYVSSPTAPVTSVPISLVKTGAVKGGFVAIWYKGAVLSSTDFTGGDVVLFHNGGMTANELCMVYIHYDLTNDAFVVSVHTGYTGTASNTAPSTLTITEAVVTGAVNTAPSTLTITEAIVTA